MKPLDVRIAERGHHELGYPCVVFDVRKVGRVRVTFFGDKDESGAPGARRGEQYDARALVDTCIGPDKQTRETFTVNGIPYAGQAFYDLINGEWHYASNYFWRQDVVFGDYPTPAANGFIRDMCLSLVVTASTKEILSAARACYLRERAQSLLEKVDELDTQIKDVMKEREALLIELTNLETVSGRLGLTRV